MTPKLPFFEWCIIILFCGILALLACFALLRKPSYPASQTTNQELNHPVTQLQVTITGEVFRPGTYELDVNTTLKDLIELADPLPSADLSRVNSRRKLYDGQSVYVPPKTPLTITILGAVQNPGTLQIMSGTRVYELANQIAFLPEADIQSIRKKRRYLKEGDLINVPSKKEKSNKKKKQVQQKKTINTKAPAKQCE
jgi:protein involved in polysaccharide export with SLBB domain